MSVRPATAADASAMARLHARSWRSAYTGLLPDPLIDHVVDNERRRTERWRQRLADPPPDGGAFVAEHESRVVGLAFWGTSVDDDAGPDTAEVQAIYLDPDAIGLGIGRDLFAATVADITDRGCPAATLWVLKANARARRFYEAAGWRADGAAKTVERPGGTLHEIRYRRELTRGPAR